MKEFLIASKDEGRRLDKWMQTNLPALPMGLREKFLRLKRIKVNGKPAARDARLAAGDTVSLYIDDEFFQTPRREDALLAHFTPHLDIVYEDRNLLIVDKRPGLIVHPDNAEKINTLITHIRAYLYQKGEYDSMNPSAFSPALCNRIDRFTGGLVIAAKNEEALNRMDAKIRAREIDKEYLCITVGCPRPPEGRLTHYLDKGEKRVRVWDKPAPDRQTAETDYRVLASDGRLALVRCALRTGRTHQIRAQFAYIGCPLLGDGQYGDARANGAFGREYQALCAWRLAFRFTTDAGCLSELSGRVFYARRVPFVRQYFPGYALSDDAGDRGY